jgi:hypothetical protein
MNPTNPSIGSTSPRRTGREMRRKDTLLPGPALGLHEATPQLAAEEPGAAARVLQLDREVGRGPPVP